ncbi:GTP 3',8-cyclase MoaA [Sphingomonas sp. LaA6.9]|uniref:GTP 3',8-cyclase MoaA n=1 Tax=Sphingomonas sp. LaA6.9 TaxID=2919914 RepID=UPI001F4FDAB8|nr:GTP 3',8-cyclase MoaA [Sphingomonas sp. LaA6.9]MCJ8156152.1 GTP 3',8-cyclase MoaA [Sphingomonas sp. LaA6.9]
MESVRDPAQPALTDGLGRRITYLRLSVTDRCDLRCRYCMAEHMSFMPRAAILSLEEMALLADRFVARGIRKIRLTGGEPLVRRGLEGLAKSIGRHIETGALDELTLTTNGTRLDEMAAPLFDAGVRRINVSLDSRDPERFRYITRFGDIQKVFAGLKAARAAGFAIKINMVALKDFNDDEIEPMLRWCSDEGFDLSLIETMPLGAIDEDRVDRFLPLTRVQEDLRERFTLRPLDFTTGGPARYWQVEELGVRMGLISPLTRNFCDGCNRIRLTVSGRLYMCLGHDDRVDLKTALRERGIDAVDPLIDEALRLKPARHDFHIDRRDAAPAVERHMSVTGG